MIPKGGLRSQMKAARTPGGSPETRTAAKGISGREAGAIGRHGIPRKFRAAGEKQGYYRPAKVVRS